MKVQILGIMDVSMTDEGGRPIDGLSLHCCDSSEVRERNFWGRHVAKVFVNRSLLGDVNLAVGQIVELHYSQTLGSKNARLTGVEVIKDK